jgi:hypothetical protein
MYSFLNRMTAWLISVSNSPFVFIGSLASATGLPVA